ncbi:hypothetical protein [Novosphingobium sp. AP12]|uniref:hypothetical protein n=1 Tax=Novosphingobium sp. AP12 TaxID=1144305 RepID=UPI00138ADFAA|nr:hypothetical protein [Novosphingobium sp. AP12]
MALTGGVLCIEQACAVRFAQAGSRPVLTDIDVFRLGARSWTNRVPVLGTRNGTVRNALHMRASPLYCQSGRDRLRARPCDRMADSGVTFSTVAHAHRYRTCRHGAAAMKQQGLDYSAFRTVPRRRLSSPREVADALLYLRPDGVSCIMGTALDALEGR